MGAASGGAVSGASEDPTGLFPTGALAPSERVLFAERPSFAKAYWGRTSLVVIVLLLLVSPFLDPATARSFAENPGTWFFVAIPIVFLVVIYSQWRHALYALTNQRLVRIGGWRGQEVRSIPIGDVDPTTAGQVVGAGVQFRYRVSISPTHSDPGGFRVKTLEWPALANPLLASPRLHGAVAAAQSEQRVQTGQERLFERIAAATMNCPYCGTPVDLTQVSRDDPKCPSCGAPLSLPSPAVRG
jgi:hypothetical protein